MRRFLEDDPGRTRTSLISRFTTPCNQPRLWILPCLSLTMNFCLIFSFPLLFPLSIPALLCVCVFSRYAKYVTKGGQAYMRPGLGGSEDVLQWSVLSDGSLDSSLDGASASRDIANQSPLEEGYDPGHCDDLGLSSRSYYSDDFESDEDDEESDHYQLASCLTDALDNSHNSSSASSPQPELPPADPVFSFGAGGARTTGLRSDAETKLGKELFSQTYTYLMSARGGNGAARKSEGDIAQHLETLSNGNEHLRNGIFIVDQMVYIELHARRK